MKSWTRSYFSIAVFTLTVLNFACAPRQDGGSSAPAAANAPVLQGTVSGGGGNGCDGRSFESYAKKISELQEYRLYLRPLLRRMAEEGSDPLLTYLQWAADEKAWYFIPCELQKLSTEQIGVAVQSDQLAIHGEHGVYIHSRENDSQTNSYFAKKSKEKASLLLHEMVMGARLLMKKSAREQCKVLAKRDANICSDPQVLAIAEVRETDRAKESIMDAADHEAVRAMTAFLSEKGVDLSLDNVRATRDRLGFVFPWDRAMSRVDFGELIKAFARSRQLEDRFKAVGGSKQLQAFKSTCSVSVNYQSDYSSNNAHFKVRFVPITGTTVTAAVNGSIHTHPKIRESICTDVMDRLYSEYDQIGPRQYRSHECANSALTPMWSLRAEGSTFDIDSKEIKARGVLVDGVVYDEVLVTKPRSYSDFFVFDSKQYDAAAIRFLVTRDSAPRIHSIRIEPKQRLKSAGAESESEQELLNIPGLAPVECVRQ